jgi:hypothetical protein
LLWHGGQALDQVLQHADEPIVQPKTTVGGLDKETGNGVPPRREHSEERGRV